MELFHGSPIIIEHPEFGKGNPMNDYGLGFYCTENADLAKEWACKIPKDGFANKYSIETEGLDVLNLSSGQWHILNWLAVLLENRAFEIGNPVAREARAYILETFLPDYKSRDIIIGYRADDSYFSYAKAFLNGAIPLKSLSQAMRLGKLGEQVCIKSSVAFGKLRFIGSEPADGDVYFVKRTSRDNNARKEYLRLLGQSVRDRESVFILDILRQEWRNDDERLR